MTIDGLDVVSDKGSQEALSKSAGTSHNEVYFDHDKNRGSVSFDAVELIDHDDEDVWMWILRDFFGEFADSYEVVEGTVKVGMHEGFYTNHEISTKQDDGSWVKEKHHGNARMRRYSASIRKRAGSIPRLVQADLDAVIASAKKKSSTRRKNHGVDCAVVNLADLQIGKTQKGLGTAENLERIYRRMDQSVEWLKEVKPKRIALTNPGDAIEGCQGFYATQEFEVDLNNRQQFSTALDVFSTHLDALYPLAEEIVLVTAPSNHGENRSNGKSVTDPARDNKDLMLSDMLAELAPHQWPNLEIETPDLTSGDPYLASFTTSSNESARRVGVIHGHQVRTAGAAPIIKLANWWTQNFMSDFNRPSEDEGTWPEHCHILLAGHFHHYNVYTGKSRILMTMPASDLGSEWYETSKGISNPAGLLCFTIDESHPHLIDQVRMFAS